MTKLNVLFLNSWYPNKVHPFNGNFIQQHARAVALLCNVACLQVETREQQEDFEISKEYDEGVLEVIVYVKKTKGLLGFFKKVILRKKAYKKGYNLIKQELNTIDVTHLNVILTAGLFALYLKRKFKIPFIITEHSTRYLNIRKDGHGFFERKIIKQVTKKASKICPVSGDLKKAMINAGFKGKYEVIPNVVNTDYFKYVEKKQSNFTKILHISSLKAIHKNWEGILNVIKDLSIKRDDFSLTIVSDGYLKPVKEYAKKLDIDSRFLEIIGEKSTPEIAEIMQEFDVFLLFSNFENLPCVISEALVSGMPVISSDVGGINEMITKKSGVLVKAKDETQLLIELERFFENKHQYNNKDIAKEAEQKYSYQSVANSYVNIYKEILKK